MGGENIELQVRAREMAVRKLVENNPDEFERYFIEYFTKLKEGKENGTDKRKTGDG
jgi:hypothetical protein